MSFGINLYDAGPDRVTIAVDGTVAADDGAELFDRVRTALEEHAEVVLDLRSCVFADPTHLTSVLRLRRNGINGSQLVLAGNGGPDG
jgi:hypothetical protein